MSRKGAISRGEPFCRVAIAGASAHHKPMAEDERRPERLVWTVRRAAAEAAHRKESRKTGILRLKPFPRIEFDDEGKNS